MPNNLPNTKYVTLSESLSWLAFGDARERTALNKELAGQVFGISYKEAKQRLETAVTMLTDAACDGKVELCGKYVQPVSRNLSAPLPDASSCLTEPIASIKLRDFRQFDITIDGLRFGGGLAWLPDEKGRWAVTTPKRTEAYAEVIAHRSHLMRAFSGGGGSAAGINKQTLTPLADSALRKWFEGLPRTKQEVPQEELLRQCKMAFPKNRVARQSIRGLTAGRQRGPKGNRP